MQALRCTALAGVLACAAAAKTMAPSIAPTMGPSAAPSVAPSAVPTVAPTVEIGDTVKLAGANEVDDKGKVIGDLKGKGKATVYLDDKTTMCFSITTNLADITAGHIHTGPKGVNGDIAVDLLSVLDDLEADPLEGCVKNLDADLVQTILYNPQEYYLNIHTKEFPKGAIRGQLLNIN